MFFSIVLEKKKTKEKRNIFGSQGMGIEREVFGVWRR